MPRKPATVTASALPTLVANIVAIYRAAPLETYSAGRSWYIEAHNLAVELDPTDVRRGAAVLAILSPRRSWPQNVALAREAYSLALELDAHGVSTEGREASWNAFPTTGDQRRKLARIFAGEDVDTVVGGPKVRSFWQTMADPHGNTADAVIDRHAMAIAEDRVFAEEELKINPATYARYVDAYRIAAEELGEAPSTVQAVTWVHWRASLSGVSEWSAGEGIGPAGERGHPVPEALVRHDHAGGVGPGRPFRCPDVVDCHHVLTTEDADTGRHDHPCERRHVLHPPHLPPREGVLLARERSVRDDLATLPGRVRRHRGSAGRVPAHVLGKLPRIVDVGLNLAIGADQEAGLTVAPVGADGGDGAVTADVSTLDGLESGQDAHTLPDGVAGRSF